MNELTPIESSWVWTGRVFHVDKPDVSVLNTAWNEVIDAIERQRVEGMWVQRVRYFNDINELTPCNVDRNLAFFRVYFGKNGI